MSTLKEKWDLVFLKTNDTLKRNLKRFMHYNLDEQCDDILDNIVEEAITKGESSYTSYCRVRVDEETKVTEEYTFTISLEKVKR